MEIKAEPDWSVNARFRMSGMRTASAAPSAMAGASAQEEINEATGKFSPCPGDAANVVEARAQLPEVD
jgi:hypothetical protein